MSIETPQTHAPLLTSVQALRGLAALLVVATHLWVIERKYSPDAITPEWFSHGAGGVDLFFVISGFIMVYVTQAATRGGKGVGEFLFARAGRIYPLYWVVSLALLAVWFVRPEMVFGSYEDPNLVKSFLLWPDVRPGNSLRPPLLLVGWTLVHEMSFYLIFALSLFLSRRFLPIFLGLWTVIFLAGNLLGADKMLIAAQIFFHPMTAEFLMGAFAGLAILRGVKFPVWIMLGLTLAALIIFPMIQPVHYGFPWTRVLVFGVPSVLLVLACVSWERQSSAKVAKPLVLLGDWSYALYLTHVLTLSLVGRIWALFSRQGLLDNIVMITLMLIATLIVSALTYILIERPLIRAVKKVKKRVFHV